MALHHKSNRHVSYQTPETLVQLAPSSLHMVKGMDNPSDSRKLYFGGCCSFNGTPQLIKKWFALYYIIGKSCTYIYCDRVPYHLQPQKKNCLRVSQSPRQPFYYIPITVLIAPANSVSHLQINLPAPVHNQSSLARSLAYLPHHVSFL